MHVQNLNQPPTNQVSLQSDRTVHIIGSVQLTPPKRTILTQLAVPSERNSGLKRISNLQLALELASRMVHMDSAVRHGTVDFSTTILEERATEAMRRVASSTYLLETKKFGERCVSHVVERQGFFFT